MRAKQFINEDWQKVNKQDKTDGMSKKAVKAYRKENPGSKLKTAVTKKPSELKAGSKDAKRRKSFCARMSGNKGPMKDEKGRPTPKAKALARWNCESIDQLGVMIEEAKKDPCWKDYKQVGMKKKGNKTVPNCVPVNEADLGTNPKRPTRPGSRPARGHEPQQRYNQGISKEKETEFHAKLDNLVHDTFGKRDAEVAEIAGAFPSPSTREKWAKDAAASNAAEAKRQADIKAKADAERLRVNNAIVDKEQRINYHPMPDNEVPAKEGWLDSKPKVDWNKRAKELFAKGMTEQQVLQQLIKEGCPPNQAPVYVQAGQMNEHKKNRIAKKYTGKPVAPVNPSEVHAKAKAKINAPKEQKVNEKASRSLCLSSKPDEDLGASNLSSCKSQGLRARDGNKSHKLGKSAKSRIKVGGHKIKGQKYGGPLPDWS